MAGAPRYDVPRAAPGGLRIVQELVNTADLENGREWLGKADDLTRWLEARGLLRNGTAVTARELRRTHDVRGALRSLLRENNGAAADPSARRTLEEAARRAKVTVEWSEEGPTLVPSAPGVDGALGYILLAVVAAYQDGSWGRLKACRSCSWAFFDASRNRSASWCSMQLCGNRRKTRAYRHRRRVSTAP